MGTFNWEGGPKCLKAAVHILKHLRKIVKCRMAKKSPPGLKVANICCQYQTAA
jgi:hypothetical protein